MRSVVFVLVILASLVASSASEARCRGGLFRGRVFGGRAASCANGGCGTGRSVGCGSAVSSPVGAACVGGVCHVR